MNKYYTQINNALVSYEDNKPYHTKDIHWICDRIDWAWKWRKISESEMIELADRATKVLMGGN